MLVGRDRITGSERSQWLLVSNLRCSSARARDSVRAHRKLASGVVPKSCSKKSNPPACRIRRHCHRCVQAGPGQKSSGDQLNARTMARLRDGKSAEKRTLRRGTRVVDVRWVQRPGRSFPIWPSSGGRNGKTKGRRRWSRCLSGQKFASSSSRVRCLYAGCFRQIGKICVLLSS